MSVCPKCKRKLKRVYNDFDDDELAIESLSDDIIIVNCGYCEYSYYCENCDEFFSI